jgi:hypothetical protein
VPTPVWREVFDTGSPACAPECRFDPGTCRGVVKIVIVWPLVGQAVQAPEHLAFAVRQIGERRDDTRMQWHAPAFPVFGFRELDMSARQVDLAPVKP